MLKMFRKTNALSILSVIIVVLGSFYLAIAILGENTWSTYILMFIFSFILILIPVFFIERYAIKLNNKIGEKLTEECDPEAYIADYEKILKTRYVPKMKTYILLNLCAGYMQSGKPEEVKRILDSLNPENINHFPNTKTGALNKADYFRFLAEYYLYVKNIDEAESALENMKLSSEHPKFNAALRDHFRNLYTNRSFQINMAKGNYDGAEESYNSSFDAVNTKLWRVSVKFGLGEICTHFGETEKAKAAFEYVIENGNKLICVQKAKEYLENNY